jgi:hypothetical protein
VSESRRRLSARRFNRFLDRVAQAFLTVGLTIATAAVVSLSGARPVPWAWLWCAVGLLLIFGSLVVPWFTESEE